MSADATVPRPRLRLSEPSSSFEIRVIEGRDAGLTAVLDGQTPGRLLLGTGPACAIALHDPAVSRRHLALDVSGDSLRVKDLGSTNGTAVNGVRVVEALLSGGERVRLGDTVLTVAAVGQRPAPAEAATGFGRVLGLSTEMRRLYPLCRKLADTKVTAIIEGETGTGKEVLAESLHEQGPRAKQPFAVFDCTAVPPNLVESELFGHERGAFTGATQARAGVFEQAHGGTLLIDEIGDLDLALQPKLLRVLERGEVRRVGGERAISVDVRVLSATRRDLDREVAAGRFRDDLFHRLAVARIELPPLRERHGDVPLLARAFAQALGEAPEALSADLLAAWSDYGWPGNVRELRNAVVRYLSLGEAFDLDRAAPPAADETADTVEAVLDAGLPYPQARLKVLEDFERRFVERALEQNGGNVSRAAAASGLARRYFQVIKARRR